MAEMENNKEMENNEEVVIQQVTPAPFTPPASRLQAIAQLLQSIADEENALANLINGEKNKILAEIGLLNRTPSQSNVFNLLETNDKVEETLRTIVKKNITLELKTQEVLELAVIWGVTAGNVEQQLRNILSSIANEESRLGDLIDAEATKLNNVARVATNHGQLLQANDSVNRLLRTIIKKEIVLEFKLKAVSDFIRDHA
jgi:hypothetical protein